MNREALIRGDILERAYSLRNDAEKLRVILAEMAREKPHNATYDGSACVVAAVVDSLDSVLSEIGPVGG